MSWPKSLSSHHHLHTPPPLPTATMESRCLIVYVLAALFVANPSNAARVYPHGTTQEDKMSASFIKSQCSATTYPALCVNSLSAYAPTIHSDPIQLANTALSVSLTSARATTALVSKLSGSGGLRPREAAALKDCVTNMGESVDELQRSIKRFGEGVEKKKNVRVKMDDVLTWVSAALTDENTCMDGFAIGGVNGEVKSTVRSHIVQVAQLTSNALALVKCLSSTN